MARIGLLIALTGVAVWLLTGTIVYYSIGNCSTIPRIGEDGTISEYNQCPWTFAQSLYFSVQTGLSIGFGLLSESQDVSKLYSIMHILAGSSFIGGALALFAELVLVRQTHFMSEEEKKLAKASAALQANGYDDGFDLQELRELMVKYPQYARAVILKLEQDATVAEEKSAQFAAASTAARIPLATAVIIEAQASLPEFQNGKMTVAQLEELDRMAVSPIRRWARENRNFVVLHFFFELWILIGWIFSVYWDQNDVITGFYFSVSTLSTAGMVSVKTVSSGAHVLFASLFAITGVPLYCAFLGSFAGLLVNSYNTRKTQEALGAKMGAAELEFLSHLSKAGNAEDVDFAEYVQFQLLRLGVIDRDLIESIRAQFSKMDKDGTGRVSLAAFVHTADRNRSRQMVQVAM